MIWEKCVFQDKTPVSVDQLGNKVYDWADAHETLARKTPWTDEQIALEGREVTSNQQRFVVPTPYRIVEQFVGKRAKIGRVIYDITQTIDLAPRYSVIQVKVYKK